ncbi:type II toxin-antitoxin system Phd/YefM family antitoxin [Aquibium microcysteis]|uniref:type II toxin-antitoxin system Phd/YefM family antitoxin n=1 Tax=Aquibium microcysteis TaxID=675281 RepID=UPI00165D2699|nr:type II toxin-antitoxin system Phd/YefM family antitoxin [Aquibium microcysteis]
MASVPASQFQKNFGEWHDRVHQGPVEITRYGRPTAYLVSADLFQQLWERFRIAVPVEDLLPGDIDLIMQSAVATDQPYTLDDIPESDDETAVLPRARG